MALLDSNSDYEGRKPLPKPIMLKDYLLDDLSSCSSNDFRSYPRQQCCATMRFFLLDNDLVKTKDSNHGKRLLTSKSANASTTKSPFQRASEAVINAVKLLPFSAVKSPNSSKKSKSRNTMLHRSRSLHRKLLTRSFWNGTVMEIKRWTSFRNLIEEKEKQSVFSDFATPLTVATDSNSSTSESNSNSKSGSNRCSDSDLFSSGNWDSSCCNDVVEDQRRLPEKARRRVGVTVGGDSFEATITTSSSTKCKWRNEEEKEQLSPISVLNFPLDDADVASSPFQSTLTRMQGTNQKLMQKIRRFEILAEPEPLDLETQYFSLPDSKDESPESPSRSPSPSPSQLYSDSSIQYVTALEPDGEEEVNDTEVTEHSEATYLLHLMKSNVPSGIFIKFTADNLLLDFFGEKIASDERSQSQAATGGGEFFHDELLNEARDWMMNRRPQEMLREWKGYFRDTEEGGRWSKAEEHKEAVAVQVEVEVFSSLVGELLFDLVLSQIHI